MPLCNEINCTISVFYGSVTHFQHDYRSFTPALMTPVSVIHHCFIIFKLESEAVRLRVAMNILDARS